MGMEPVEIGKRSFPSFFSIAIGSFGTGYYLKRYGKYYKFLMASCIISICGQLQINLQTPNLPVWKQYCLLILPGIGVAVLITVSLVAMTASVSQEQQAAVTSISYAFRTTGCTLGVSIGTAIFQNSLTKSLSVRVMEYLSDAHSREELSSIVDKALRSSDWSNKHAPKFIRQTLLDCYDSACHSTFRFCCLCIILATFFCSIIKEYPLLSSIKRHSSTWIFRYLPSWKLWLSSWYVLIRVVSQTRRKGCLGFRIKIESIYIALPTTSGCTKRCFSPHYLSEHEVNTLRYIRSKMVKNSKKLWIGNVSNSWGISYLPVFIRCWDCSLKTAVAFFTRIREKDNRT